MVLDALNVLLDYASRLLPAFGLFAAWFCLTPRSQTGARLLILVMAFVFARDLMTPFKLWAIACGGLHLQFHANPMVLASLGITSILMVAMLARLTPEQWKWVVGFKGNRVVGFTMGVMAGCMIGIPLRLHQGIELAAAPWLLGFAVFALGGNALEEVLFRGMLQGLLERHTSPIRAALGSAIAFSACHLYLAFMLTQVGWPILAFTFFEGLVCASVRLKWGTVPAIAAHGTAIGLLGIPLL